MNTVDVTYLNGLRCEATHLKSGNQLITDAPTDNHGKGEAFSPTDLIAASLLTCMITVMGIKAENKGLVKEMGKVTGSVKKIMVDQPRRVAQLNVTLVFEDQRLSTTDRKLLESTAMNCPVAKSIHPDINQQVQFQYS